MGSAPSKGTLRKAGLLFVDTSDTESGPEEDEIDQVTNITFTDVTTTSFVVKWKAPKGIKVEKYHLRIFPPDGLRCRTWVSNCQDNCYEFDRLSEGKSYTIGIVVVDTMARKSGCATGTESTRPVPPTMMIFPTKATTATAVVVCWKHSKGSRDYYEASIEPVKGVKGPTHATKIYNTEHTFTGLVPGVEYTVIVVSVSSGMTSPKLESTVTTRPGTVLDVVFTEVTNSEISIRWKAPPGVVETYTLSLQDAVENSDPVVIAKINLLSYTFNGLRAGRSYILKVITHALNKESIPKEFFETTTPNGVTSLSCQNITMTSSTITWFKPQGDAESYDLFLSPREGVQGETNPTAIVSTSYDFKGLLPGTTYTVGVVTNAKEKTSKRVVASFLTEPCSCGNITFHSANRNSTSLEVCWAPAKGGVDSYTLEIKNVADIADKTKIEDIKACAYMATNLVPGNAYKFTVTTTSSGLESPSTSAECSTFPKPVKHVLIVPKQSTSRSIMFEWQPQDGDIERFKIRTISDDYLFEHEVANECREFELLDLIPSKTYNISVSCVSNGLESEPVTETFATGADKVDNLAIKVMNKNEIYVEWSPANAMVDVYQIILSPKDIDENLLYVLHTWHTFSGLIPGTRYTVTISPKTQNVIGAPTEISAFTTPGDILNVHFPADHLTENCMKMIWGVEGPTSGFAVQLTKEDRDGEGSVYAEKTLKYNLKNVTEYTFQELEANTLYKVTIQTVSETGEMGALTSVSQTTAKKSEPEPEEKAEEKMEEKMEEKVEEEANAVENSKIEDKTNKRDPDEKKSKDSSGRCSPANSIDSSSSEEFLE